MQLIKWFEHIHKALFCKHRPYKGIKQEGANRNAGNLLQLRNTLHMP